MSHDICKTTFVFEVLHFEDDEPVDLRHAMSEAWDGCMVGLDKRGSTERLPPDDVFDALVAMGNDGTFFDDITAGEEPE